MQFLDGIRNNIYKITLPIAVAGVALAAYFHPVPIARGWGDIAARDMAAKTNIAYDIKNKLAAYSEDGVWSGGELVDLTLLTNPREFTEHRTEETGPIFGIIPRFENPFTPTSALEDILYDKYNRLFSDGTRGVPKGEFASYHEARQRLFRELYATFANKGNVGYEDWIKGRTLMSKMPFESNLEYARRIYNGHVNMDAAVRSSLDNELDRMIDYFSSIENQNIFRKYADSVAEHGDMAYNAFLLLFGTIPASLIVADKIRKS